jgi:hypothetical protein
VYHYEMSQARGEQLRREAEQERLARRVRRAARAKSPADSGEDGEEHQEQRERRMIGRRKAVRPRAAS